MNLTNSKLIIGTFNLVSNVLNGIAGFMGNIEAQIPVFTVIGALTLGMLGNKMKEMQLAREQAKLDRELAIQKQQDHINEMKANEDEYIKAAVERAKKIQDNQLLAAVRDEEIAQKRVSLAEDEEARALGLLRYQEKKVEMLEVLAGEKDINEVKEDRAETEAKISAEIAEQAALREGATQADKDAARKAQEDYENLKKGNQLNDKDKNIYKEKLKTARKQLKEDQKAYKQAQKNTKIATEQLNRAKAKTKAIQDGYKDDKALAEQEKKRFQESIEQQEKILGHMKQQGTAMGVLGGIGNIVLSVFSGIATVVGTIAAIIKLVNALKEKGIKLDRASLAAKIKEWKQTLKNKAAEEGSFLANLKNAAVKMAGSAASIPVAGWVIAAAILAALIGIGIGVAASMGAFSKKESEAADNIKKLNAEIYKLEESAQSLDTTADHFENLDNKILKTKEDIQAMNEDLEKLGETMSEEDPDDGKNDTEYDKDIAKITDGKSEAEYYAGLTDEEKIKFARQKAEAQRKEADRKRDEQIKEMQSIGHTVEDGRIITAEEHQRHLLETDKEVRDAFYAYNKNQLYDYIDALKAGSEEMAAISEEEALMLEGVTQNLLDNMDA